jgi:DNA-binding MarR family transcriptional regulator
MAAQILPASPLLLRDPEIRRGVELLYFGYGHMTRSIDRLLAQQGLGRAHHRALYFIARQPGLSVSNLLSLLSITKQSLGRVLTELQERGLVEVGIGQRDRRQRLLTLSKSGEQLEAELFGLLRERMSAAYERAGADAVTGFWKVLEGLIPEEDRARVFALQRRA